MIRRGNLTDGGFFLILVGLINILYFAIQFIVVKTHYEDADMLPDEFQPDVVHEAFLHYRTHAIFYGALWFLSYVFGCICEYMSLSFPASIFVIRPLWMWAENYELAVISVFTHLIPAVLIEIYCVRTTVMFYKKWEKMAK